MGRGAELLILPLGAMALLSLCAFFAAFFNRTATRVLAGLSLGIAGLFLLLILQTNRWNFEWLFFLLRQASLPFIVLYASVLLSFVAVLAPLRRGEKISPSMGKEPARPRWVVFGIACGVTTLLAGFGMAQLVDSWRGEWKTIALLSGDANVRLIRLQVDYQQRRLVCSDPIVLRYLEERFRKYDPNRRELGTTYQMSLSYEGGGTRSFATYWGDSGDFALFIGDAGEGGKGHGILLTPQGLGLLNAWSTSFVKTLAKRLGQS